MGSLERGRIILIMSHGFFQINLEYLRTLSYPAIFNFHSSINVLQWNDCE